MAERILGRTLSGPKKTAAAYAKINLIHPVFHRALQGLGYRAASGSLDWPALPRFPRKPRQAATRGSARSHCAGTRGFEEKHQRPQHAATRGQQRRAAGGAAGASAAHLVTASQLTLVFRSCGFAAAVCPTAETAGADTSRTSSSPGDDRHCPPQRSYDLDCGRRSPDAAGIIQRTVTSTGTMNLPPRRRKSLCWARISVAKVSRRT